MGAELDPEATDDGREGQDHEDSGDGPGEEDE
jgi:hypothetical protein